jgi:hypothetical protein
MKNKQKIKLNSWYVLGFLDAESSFTVVIHKNKKMRTGWEVRASFVLGLNKKEKKINRTYTILFWNRTNL